VAFEGSFFLAFNGSFVFLMDVNFYTFLMVEIIFTKAEYLE